MSAAALDELVEIWLQAMEQIGEVFSSLRDPAQAAQAVGKVQEIASGVARFSELGALSAEDSQYIHEKYGDQIARATNKSSQGMLDAAASPLGGAISGALTGFPMIGQ